MDFGTLSDTFNMKTKCDSIKVRPMESCNDKSKDLKNVQDNLELHFVTQYKILIPHTGEYAKKKRALKTIRIPKVKIV